MKEDGFLTFGKRVFRKDESVGELFFCAGIWILFSPIPWVLLFATIFLVYPLLSQIPQFLLRAPAKPSGESTAMPSSLSGATLNQKDQEVQLLVPAKATRVSVALDGAIRRVHLGVPCTNHGIRGFQRSAQAP